MAMFSHSALIAVAVFASGCSQLVTTASEQGVVSRTTNANGAGYLVPARSLIPNATLQLTPGFGVSLETLIIGAAAYHFIDPLAPNWRGEVSRLSDDTYRITLRMKRFKTGGDGESLKVFQRNADHLVREGGFTGYTVLSLTEGLESEVLGTVRVSEGTIRVSRATVER